MSGFDLDAFIAAPRVSGLALSPDGTRLVTSVATVAPDGKKFVTALWEVDPSGQADARRLTRSAPGEAGPAFLPDGGVVFTSKRPDPDGKADDKDDERARLWLLPMDGAEARPVLDAPAGVRTVAVARSSGNLALAVDAFPGTQTPEEDEELFKKRKETGVAAQLFEEYPIRFWDHYLGPRETRLFVSPPVSSRPDGLAGPLRQVSDGAQRALDDTSFDITPDGSLIVTGWRLPGLEPTTNLVALDAESGERRVLGDGQFDYDSVRCSPDGSTAVCVRSQHGTKTTSGPQTLWLVSLQGDPAGRDLTPELDLWPGEPHWSSDGSAIFFVADEGGRVPVFRLDVATGSVTRLSQEGAFSNLCPSPDGEAVYAIRNTILSAPEVVRLDARAGDQQPVVLPTPGAGSLESPARLEELTATAADGVGVHSWLLLPPDASASSPAPLVVFIHGGPLGSWNAWSWRWNPNLLVARGYAVLLPDPAISTGYGQDFINRGRARWGLEPFTDLMAAVDGAVGRPDIDETRTAAMGGSFGGYMANWVAGHTDRFKGIITHASLWALDQFHGTTDHALWWEREFGDPYTDTSVYEANSPHRHVANISTPMLVIHGELDHRVPIGEALRLWTDLKRHGVDARFLYFPDENHWILKPQNSRLWYETVFAFLDHTVHGKDWEAPALLA